MRDNQHHVEPIIPGLFGMKLSPNARSHIETIFYQMFERSTNFYGKRTEYGHEDRVLQKYIW